MQRRTFVKSIPVAFATTFLGALQPVEAARKKKSNPKPFDVKDTDTLLVQSGVFGSDLFVIGVLQCTNPAAVNQRIQAARRSSKYRCVLTHRSRNKYKAAYFDALLADWLNHDDLKIQLRMVLPPKPPEQPVIGAAWMRGYVDQLSSAMAMGGLPAQAGRILTQPRFKAKQQSEYEKMLLARNDRIKSIEKVAVKNCELMQFLVTLTGVVRASEIPGEHGHTKEKTISMLRSRLKTYDFKKPQRRKQFELTVI